MLKPLFWSMLAASSSYYGDSIGLAPIALGKSNRDRKSSKTKDFWFDECSLHPRRIA